MLPADRLRAAVVAGDQAATLEALADHVRIGTTGCWLAPNLRSDGYPRLYVAGKWRPLHRIACAAAHGPAPAGVAAHHRCANRACVRPDHLQWVTNYDNTAEMLGRRGYLARIAELEAALAVASPAHALLPGGVVDAFTSPAGCLLGADVVDAFPFGADVRA